VTLPAGSRLGPYEILGQIGAGGMGEVYRARDPRLAREVAIKVLPASFSTDAERLRRFEQEAKAAGVLNHPNITAVYDIGTNPDDGSPYVVQELLEGETLRVELAGGRLSPRRAIDDAIQIAQGLAAAHEKGIVHRDLKPENLFVTRDGRVKILDFGLAKLIESQPGAEITNLPTETRGTEPGVVLGTLGYMSPEQVRGRPADARSDIFSFGAIFYEMLSGTRAFQGDSSADTMSAILREDPPDLSATNRSISPGLERIVRHCLEKNPERVSTPPPTSPSTSRRCRECPGRRRLRPPRRRAGKDSVRRSRPPEPSSSWPVRSGLAGPCEPAPAPHRPYTPSSRS
jgi:serine/threonine protein kinase